MGGMEKMPKIEKRLSAHGSRRTVKNENAELIFLPQTHADLRRHGEASA